MLQIVTDLERIGDYAVDIAKNAIKLIDVPLRPARVEIGRAIEVGGRGSVDLRSDGRVERAPGGVGLRADRGGRVVGTATCRRDRAQQSHDGREGQNGSKR